MNSRHNARGRDLPFVFLNVAVTADGKIATANRAVHSFGSKEDLNHLYELRATADAVMSGARTVEISEPTLGNGGEKFRRLRVKNGLAKHPLRIIASGSGSVNPKSKIFTKNFSPIIVLASHRAPEKKLGALRKLATDLHVSGKTEIDFVSTFRWLREKWNVKRLLCEGGGDLNDALFRSGLVDEIHMTFCPKIFGGRTAPTLSEGLGHEKLATASKYKLARFWRKKAELFTIFARA